MSSEEKEPYFDGPLVTPSPDHAMFYPGAHPALGPRHVAPLSPPGPTFYNPNNFARNAVGANPWGPIPFIEEPQQQRFNVNPPGDAALPGAQNYFGGVDSNSSASSSQQTSPEHLPQQKVNDVPYNPVPYENQLYGANGTTMFTPQVDAQGGEPSSEMYNPSIPPVSGFSSEQQGIQNPILPPGGASGQHGYAHPPAPPFFLSNSETGGLQNYMNPVPHSAPTQMPHFTPVVEEQNFSQAPTTEGNLHNEESSFKGDSASPINPTDLHNGTPSYSQSGNDQSYMNMAYNHNYSAMAPQVSNVNAYVGAEFQVGASNVMIPASSSQDYDILHSQGTWKEQNHDVTHGPNQTVVSNAEMTNPSTDERREDPVHGSDSTRNMENVELEGNASHAEAEGNQAQAAEGPRDDCENIVQSADQKQQSLEETPSNDLPDNRTMVPLNDSDNQERLLEPLNHIGAYGEDLEVVSGSYANASKAVNEMPETDAKDTLLSLDYDNGTESAKLPDLQARDVVYGSMPGGDRDEGHQSYQMRTEDQASSHPELSSQTGQKQQSPFSNGDKVLGPPAISENVTEPESSESPIPADGLHPKQTDILPNYSESPHHFASPNSAFESRIRSQSTGSNNSNASSQRSANSLPNRNPQVRQQIAATAPLEAIAPRQDSVPTSNPFNTNTMHSSHVTDISTNHPVTAVPTLSGPISPIPDIVRPLPGGFGDENLRTGATVPLSSNQSLHSQVLRNRVTYSPEPPPTVSVPVTRMQPDIIQSPSEPEQLRPRVELSHVPMELKTDNTPANEPSASIATTSQRPNADSDPYLSHSLHTDLQPFVSVSHDSGSQPTARAYIAEQSAESLLPPSSGGPSSDLHQGGSGHPDTRRQHNEDFQHQRIDEPARGHYDEGRDHRDQRWDDRRSRPDEEYRREDRPRGGERYSRGWDSRDERYRDDRYDDHTPRSRQEHSSRPGSRQSSLAEPYYSRPYDDRGYRRDYTDPYYRDRYHDDVYQRYDRRDPYYSYDDRYYDPYYRYPDAWHGPGRHYYDQYYYDPYYGNYHYNDQRRQDEEETRSMRGERSRVAENDPERDWQTRHSYTDHYDYRSVNIRYDQRYYEDSLADESTLSNMYDESWRRLPQVPARQTPVKFTMTHTIVRFGAGGQLIKVLPNRPTDNQPSTVEIHNLEIILQNTQEAEDLRSYPGPLSKEVTHKNDVLQFAAARSSETMRNTNLIDRRSTALIWDFLALLVRQNGSVLGTDIAELLTKDHCGDFTLLQSPLEESRQRQLQLQQRTATPNSISDDQGSHMTKGSVSPAPDQSESKSVASNQSADIKPIAERNNRFRELLLHGRKNDALEWAMKSGLWGHALLLASKTDSRTHGQVMLRFANSLPINDPLQTVYQLMSGRQPAAATCVSEEGWGDWRPHLAMILSNPTSSPSLDMRTVLTMGDTLSSRGLLHAAHFCYLMSSTPLGYYGRPTSKMVLLGGNHMLPFHEFSTWDSIRRTEIYEYAVSLGKPQRPNSNSATTALPAFQLYKFLYACKLAEYGLVSQAFHYCEHVAKSVCRRPASYSPALINQLVNVSDQLRHHDPQIQAGVCEAGSLQWLETLRNINSRIQRTVSNTPSAASTSPTTDENDEIRFSAHTPDQEEDEDVQDSGLPSSHVGMQKYGQSLQQVPVYSNTPDAPSVMTPDTNLQQQPTQFYPQEQNQIVMPVQNTHPLQGYHQGQQFVQPSGQTYAQPSVVVPNFSHLANQANPLATGYPPQGAQSVPYQQQNSYGFTSGQPATANEEAERTDQVDYYDYMANSHKSHLGRAGSPRSRTTSQSSQRSRASTLKGYDRTTPTSMMNHHHSDKGRRSRTTSENSGGRRSRKTSGEQSHPQSKPKSNDDMGNMGVRESSWSKSLFGWLRRKSNQVHLPDDKEKEIVWDNEKKKWVNKNAPEEESAPPAPPPLDNATPNPTPQMQPFKANQNQNNQPAPSEPSGEPQLTSNRFSLKNLGGNRSMYKNAFSTSSKPVVAPAPVDLLPGLQNPAAPQLTGFMIPNPVPTSQPEQDPTPAAASTPMHAPGAVQSIQMFTPGNTPHGSANDFRQPFRHGGNSTSSSVSSTAREVRNLTSVAEEEGTNTASQATEKGNAAPGPTMFFNPSQFAAQPNLLAQPGVPSGRGSALTHRGRGRPGYPGRR